MQPPGVHTFLVRGPEDKRVHLHDNEHALPRVVDDSEFHRLTRHLLTDVVSQKDVLKKYHICKKLISILLEAGNYKPQIESRSLVIPFFCIGFPQTFRIEVFFIFSPFLP